MMTVLRSFVLAVTMGVVSLSTAHAHDSFNVGINTSHNQHAYPAVSYHAVPQVVYYNVPVYRHPAPHAYYRAPVVVYQHSSYGESRHHYHGHGYCSERGYGRHGRYH